MTITTGVHLLRYDKESKPFKPLILLEVESIPWHGITRLVTSMNTRIVMSWLSSNRNIVIRSNRIESVGFYVCTSVLIKLVSTRTNWFL